MHRRIILKTLVGALLAATLLAAPAAQSQIIINNYRYSAGGPNRCAALGDTVSTTVFDIDATCSNSYSGSGQTVSSLETTPADGAAQSAYVFDFGNSSGASSDDPGFTGTPGDTGAYFTFDGGDYFELDGTNTSFINNLAKTTGGQDFWVALVFYNQTAGATQGLASVSGSASLPGIFTTINSGEHPVFAQRGDTASVTNTFSGITLSNNTWYLLVLSYSHSTNEVAIWVNSLTGTTASMTFNATTTDPNTQMRIFRSTSTYIANSARARTFAMGNGYLDNTEAGKIFTALEARHSADYTP